VEPSWWSSVVPPGCGDDVIVVTGDAGGVTGVSDSGES
jgi:hypothetical protein